jgi:hypothetical protein
VFIILPTESVKSLNQNIVNNRLQKDLIINEILKFKKPIPFLNKNLILGSLLFIFLGSLIIWTIFFSNFNDDSFNDNSLNSGYEIYNLKGDVVDTWLSWKIPENTIFHVHLADSQYVDEERIDVIKQVVMSSEFYDSDNKEVHEESIDHKRYYLGWTGALNSISADTQFPLPNEIHFHTSDNGDGNIIINLKKNSHPDGYAGFTKSITDESNNQILKSVITIFDIDNLSNSDLKSIVRHELGHGFGLAHSTDPEDLMYPTIRTAYPFISPCVIDAMTDLYDGSKNSVVICNT